MITADRTLEVLCGVGFVGFLTIIWPTLLWILAAVGIAFGALAVMAGMLWAWVWLLDRWGRMR